METGKLVYELKRPIKVVVDGESVDVSELVFSEPNNYNLNEFYNFQAMGLELFRKELEKKQQNGEIPENDASASEEEVDYKAMADMIRILMFSSYSTMKPSNFIDAFKKVIFCKNKSYVSAMDVDVKEAYFRNVHRDDLARIACEYFAFFGMTDFLT